MFAGLVCVCVSLLVIMCVVCGLLWAAVWLAVLFVCLLIVIVGVCSFICLCVLCVMDCVLLHGLFSCFTVNLCCDALNMCGCVFVYAMYCVVYGVDCAGLFVCVGLIYNVFV